MTNAAHWPFEDPKDLECFTLPAVLSGAAPILFVSHDVDDGCWQFLSGENVLRERPKLVALSAMVDLDPTLAELATLPLGSFAERSHVGAPWQRQSLFPTEWEAFVDDACAFAVERQAEFKREFSLSQWERYDYAQDDASLVFSRGGVARLSARTRLVGSVSKKSNTWLWSWANTTIVAKARAGMEHVRKFGEQHRFEKLVTPSWPADDVDGWEMTNIVCRLFGGAGVYRVPDESGALFLVLSNPRLLAQDATPR